MASITTLFLNLCAAVLGGLSLLYLTHLVIMAVLRPWLVLATFSVVFLIVGLACAGAIWLVFDKGSLWLPMLFGFIGAALISRELADVIARARDRKTYNAKKPGWLEKIDGQGRLAFRGHIYRAAAAAGRTRFETNDEAQDFWLVRWKVKSPEAPPPSPKPKSNTKQKPVA